MADKKILTSKPTLDKDLNKLAQVEQATGIVVKGLMGPGIAVIFIIMAMVFASAFVAGQSGFWITMAAAAVGGYMALNIGANDVANNVGPAVGSKAMTMGTALIIAAVFESTGALLAGGDVVNTISKGIIDVNTISDKNIFIAVMMAALVSSAVWVNIATWFGAPVSTTHSIVGGVMGAGIAAAGFDAVEWVTMGKIAASWVISPLLGGIIAAMFLAFIKEFIIYQDDKIAASKRWVPVLIAIMAAAFSAYLSVKGFKKIIKIDLSMALMIGAATFIVTWAITKPLIAKQAEGLENRNQSIRKLFAIPLVCSAALLSFAHGANDVANAVGPLAAIVHTVGQGDVAAKVEIPIWVMMVGAAGISLGLFLFGPKLIKMVGTQITKLNPMRAYCVALSAAITVIVASWLGLPVSSTHIAVGAVFGVGFFREWYTKHSKKRNAFVKAGKSSSTVKKVPAKEEVARRKLVRRSHFMTIVAAWVITVPIAAILSAVLFYVISAIIV